MAYNKEEIEMVKLELDWTPINIEDYLCPNEKPQIIDHETGEDITHMFKPKE